MYENTWRNIGIIYEDNHLLVVDKPINMLSQGDITGDVNLLDSLKEYIKEKYNKPGNVYLGLVHRLDRPVGGIMVFARTSKAASRISDQIRKRTFKKTYIAVIHGVPTKKASILHHYLIKDTKNNISYVAEGENDGAKEAILDYKILDSKQGLSLVQINLHTGRPHQIRVQFSYDGFPLYGDTKYGMPVTKEKTQLALYSYAITLSHPVQKNEMTFSTNLPETYPWNLFS